MNRPRTRSSCTILALTLLAGACSFTPAVADDPVAFNRAAAEARDRVLLLNIVRAAHRYPMQFTALSLVRGNIAAQVGASVGSSLDLGSGSDSLSPRVEGSLRSNPSFDVAVLNSAEFTRGVMQPLDVDRLHLYVEQGWPARLLANLLLESIHIGVQPAGKDRDAIEWHSLSNNPGEDYTAFKRALDVFLGHGTEAPASNRRRRFRFESNDNVIAAGISRGALDQLAPALITSNGQVRVRAASSPSNTLELVRGSGKGITLEQDLDEQDVRGLLAVLGVDSSSVPQKSLSKEDFEFAFDADPTMAEQSETPPDPKTNGNRARIHVQLVLRSPHSVAYYLGELARYRTVHGHDAGPEHYPHVAPGESEQGEAVPLFQVAKGDDDPMLSVDFQGVDYSIPAGSAGDRSRQCLALLHQLFGLQQSRAELPTTQFVSVSSP